MARMCWRMVGPIRELIEWVGTAVESTQAPDTLAGVVWLD